MYIYITYTHPSTLQQVTVFELFRPFPTLEPSNRSETSTKVWWVFRLSGPSEDSTNNSTNYFSASHDRHWSPLGLLALAASQGGAYLGFGLQYALLTPFVLELGVPIQWASIIWLGMFVQPLVGRLSDARSTSSGGWAALTKRFGRRRPFLAVGGLVLVLAQLLV
ncbi:Sucrose transport protein SUC4 (Sucrose permease 4) (Sucrose transporter 4) (Sucrose-proton symporter 4), partial [Durusdinium trenchii]